MNLQKAICTSLLGLLTLGASNAGYSATFVVEAEDFDYGGGQYHPDINSMPYYGALYDGLGATHGVDYFRTTTDWGADMYRYAEDPNVPVFYGQNPEALDRVEWTTVFNFKIGFMYQPSWYNYTRNFPIGNYRVYAALYDGSPVPTENRIRANLGVVTSGVGTAEQTVQPIGDFIGTGSGRWDIPTIVMLTSEAGPVTLALNGLTTLRFNSDFGDFDYLLFVPENAPSLTIAANASHITAGESLVLSSTVSGAGPLTYQWRFNGTDIPGANSATYEVPAAGMEHTGHYSLFAANEYGAMVSSTLQVKVSYRINIGDTVSPDFPSAGAGVLTGIEEDVYIFEGNAGDAIFFEGLQGEACGGLSVRMLSPKGEQFFDRALGTCIDLDPRVGMILPESGTYAVVVFSRGFLSDPNYSFRIVQLPPVHRGMLSIGETASGETVNAMDVYQFEAGSAGAVYIQELDGTGCFEGHKWAIYDPNGNLLRLEPLGVGCEPVFSSSPLAVQLPASGTYTLKIVPGFHGGTYGFTLLESTVQVHPIQVGATITPNLESGAGILEALGSADIYEFSGEGGESVYFHGRVSPEDVNANFNILGTAGGLGVLGSFGSSEFTQQSRLYELPYTGTYRITINSPTLGIGSYSFQILPSEGIQTFQYTLGETISLGSLPAGYLDPNGAVDEFIFTVPEPGRILSFVDLGSEGSNLKFMLQEIAPWPTWPQIDDVLDGDSVEEATGGYTPGKYRITITSKDGDPAQFGWYSFKVAVHNPPVAVGDSNFKTKRGKSVRIPKGKLMANDYDPDGDEVTWFGFSADPFLSNGTIVDEGDTLLFTPTAGYHGVAEFTYQIQDTFPMVSAPAVVRILVE